MKRMLAILLCTAVTGACFLTGCQTTEDTASGSSAGVLSISEEEAETGDENETEDQTSLPDGEYEAVFETDSSMFHVNEACDGKGALTVKDGRMTIHISLVSKNIVNLYPGLAEDAVNADESEWLTPTTDTVTYSDGITEEVYGFDVPVPALDEEFDLAILGKKGEWYDHKVSVSEPTAVQKASLPELEDGMYTIAVSLEGGSGKSTVESPCTLIVENGEAIARIRWSSSHYDYMLIGEQKYLPVNEEGNSVFEIPVTVFDAPMDVVGDTTAMSTPHEIEYTLTFDTATLVPAE